jgi:hypothetical protein
MVWKASPKEFAEFQKKQAGRVDPVASPANKPHTAGQMQAGKTGGHKIGTMQGHKGREIDASKFKEDKPGLLHRAGSAVKKKINSVIVDRNEAAQWRSEEERAAKVRLHEKRMKGEAPPHRSAAQRMSDGGRESTKLAKDHLVDRKGTPHSTTRSTKPESVYGGFGSGSYQAASFGSSLPKSAFSQMHTPVKKSKSKKGKKVVKKGSNNLFLSIHSIGF